MYPTRIDYTSVKHESTRKSRTAEKTLDSWDAAIQKAKDKIVRLRKSIKYFEESKKNGDPWPSSGGYKVTKAGTAGHSVPA